MEPEHTLSYTHTLGHPLAYKHVCTHTLTLIGQSHEVLLYDCLSFTNTHTHDNKPACLLSLSLRLVKSLSLLLTLHCGLPAEALVKNPQLINSQHFFH